MYLSRAGCTGSGLRGLGRRAWIRTPCLPGRKSGGVLLLRACALLGRRCGLLAYGQICNAISESGIRRGLGAFQETVRR